MKIIALMGKSATGKDTIKKYLTTFQKTFIDSPQYTTRPMRRGEENGKEYNFVNVSTFEKMRDNNELVEYRSYDTKFGKWFYFTAKKDIDLDSDNVYITICTLESYKSFVDYVGQENMIPIYLYANAADRLERSIKRINATSTDLVEICRRFIADEEDFSDDKLEDLSIPVYSFCGENVIFKISEIEDHILKLL